MDKEQFPERLRRLREAAGLSQEELGKALYVTRQAVSKWECGESTPDINTIVKLAEYFGVSVDTLVSGKPETPSVPEQSEQPEQSEKKVTPPIKSRTRIYAAASAVMIALSFAAIFIMLPFMPNSVPAHYAPSGAIDRWGSKYEYLAIPCSSVIVAVIIAVTGMLMKKSVTAQASAMGESRKSLDRMALIIFITSICVYLMFAGMTVGFAAHAVAVAGSVKPDMFTVCSTVLASTLMTLGTVMPFTKPNFLLGIRTSNTLSDAGVWKKVHIISGVIFTAVGLFECLFNVFYNGSTVKIIVFSVTFAVAIAAAVAVAFVVKPRSA